MIKVKNLRKTYNNQLILGIDEFAIDRNGVYLITGPNGSGKSTFGKMLAGIECDDNGKRIMISEDGIDLNVGYLPQNPYIFDLSLEKNIFVKIKNEKKSNYYIDKFEIGYLRGKNAKKFSGGEKQKMSLARFMMDDYDVAIFDEPTSAMDDKSKKIASTLIKEYSKDKIVIVITHDMTYLDQIALRIFKMADGKLI